MSDEIGFESDEPVAVALLDDGDDTFQEADVSYLFEEAIAVALPVPPNTTAEGYRSGNSPPAAPDVASQPIYLRANYRLGIEASERAAALTFTHEAIFEKTVDVRDHYTGVGAFGVNPDTWYVPDRNGTGYLVKFVETIDRGTALERFRVYLDRQAVAWPAGSNEL